MNKEERLKEYLEKDEIYQEYLNGETHLSDFDMFCIQHCKDIEKMLNENEELKKNIRKAYIKMEEMEEKYGN